MNDEALRENIAEIIYGVGDVPKDTHLPDVEAILHLIAEDRERVEREARLNELQRTFKYGKTLIQHGHYKVNYQYAKARLAALTNKLKQDEPKQ